MFLVSTIIVHKLKNKALKREHTHAVKATGGKKPRQARLLFQHYKR